MKKQIIAIAILAAAAASAQAHDNWVSSDGTIWRSGFGLCWQDAGWTPATAGATDCGKPAAPMAKPAPAPMPAPVAKPAPMPAPAPAPAPVVQRAIVPATVTLSADALFAFNKSATGDILPAGRAQLDALVAAVRKDNVAVRTVNVIGHADPLGSAAYNEKLAAARAETVRAYLASQLNGVTVTGEGRGEREPVVTTCGNTATKKSIECNAPNRRVVVQLSGTK